MKRHSSASKTATPDLIKSAETPVGSTHQPASKAASVANNIERKSTPGNLGFEDSDEDQKPVISKKRRHKAMADNSEDEVMSHDVAIAEGKPGKELTMELLRKKASPIIRARAEHDWGDLTSSVFKPDDGKYLTIAVRAIGNHLGRYKPAPDSPLTRALLQLEITPKVLHNCEHVDYPYEWLVIIAPKDVQKLPSYTNDVRGIFCDPNKSSRMSFIWTIPLYGNLMKPDFLRHELRVDGEKPEDCTPITVSEVRPIQEKTPGIWAKWKGTTVCLVLDPTCAICGADEHPPGDEDCPYEAALAKARSRDAKPKMLKVGSSDEEDAAIFSPFTRT